METTFLTLGGLLAFWALELMAPITNEWGGLEEIKSIAAIRGYWQLLFKGPHGSPFHSFAALAVLHVGDGQITVDVQGTGDLSRNQLFFRLP